jgi:hypothetical protein
MFGRFWVGSYAFVPSQVFLALLSSRLPSLPFVGMARFGYLTAGDPADPKCCSFVLLESTDEGCLGVAPANFAPIALAHFSCPIGEDKPDDFGEEVLLDLVRIPPHDFVDFTTVVPTLQPSQFNDAGAWPDLDYIEAWLQDFHLQNDLGDDGAAEDYASVVSQPILGDSSPPPRPSTSVPPLIASGAGRGRVRKPTTADALSCIQRQPHALFERQTEMRR